MEISRDANPSPKGAWARRGLAIAVPVILLAVDRLAKWYAQAALPTGRGAVLVPGLHYEFFRNDGLAFSVFSPTVATVAACAAYLALAVFALRHKFLGRTLAARELWSFALIAAGGASNVFDRLYMGGVTDYLIFARSAWNIADIMILAGIALMLRVPKGDKRSDG
jgi:lipoprotein signal peptidase